MTERSRKSCVFTIPPDVSFLKTLAKSVLNGSLLPDGFDVRDPVKLASVSIYLPTQRSARMLENTFVECVEQNALLLPRIKALGDHEEGDSLRDIATDIEPNPVPLPPAISPRARQLILTQMVLAWGRAMERQKSPTRKDDQPLLVPASAADAAWLAADLGVLLDRALTENISWADLNKLVPDDFAAFWQMSLEFLTIATKSWPAILAERGMVEQVTRRDMLIARECERLQTHKGPIIAAGSTGTLPSTAKFLAAVAHMPNGVLVLPGLDKAMDDEVFDAIGGSHNRGEASSGHPQYGLKQLLVDFVKIKLADVQELGERHPALAQRTSIVAHAMIPAAVTDKWQSFRQSASAGEIEAAFRDVSLIDAKNDSDEALSIACVCREFVETETGLACLVTPDRALARRVALELKRWNLEVDDSAGRPIVKTAPAILAQLVIDVIASDFDPVILLSLLKHPLADFGLKAELVRRAARVLDLAVLRGPRIVGGAHGLARRLENIKDEVLRGTAKGPDVTGAEVQDHDIDFAERAKSRNAGRLHPAIAQYDEEDWDAADTLVTCLVERYAALEAIYSNEVPCPLAILSNTHRAAVDAISTKPSTLDPAIAILAQHFDTLSGVDGDAFSIMPKEYSSSFRALLGSETVRQKGAEDTRILILGALEARLMDPDLIILAALDEGTWPQQAKTDAFLSRTMCQGLGLEAPERRTGLAAHDICQGLGANRVVLTRAAKRSGAPVVMSRWLQRIQVLIGADQTRQMKQRGRRYLQLAEHLDRPVNPVSLSASRPNPKPPIKARPDRLSVTRIETWVRDPYAIYADRILGLKPIDPLGNIPGFAERGTIIHEVMDRFNMVWNGVADDEAFMRLKEIGAALFNQEMRDFPDQRALWWPRFERIARAYLNWEEKRQPEAGRRYSEVSGKLELTVDGIPFTLTGTLDRLDELSDGTLSIIDFKTGEPPSAKQVKSGLAAQLALEVTMLQGGAFDVIAPLSTREVSQLGWIKLDGRHEAARLRHANIIGRKGVPEDTPSDLGHHAKGQLIGLIRQYRNPDQGYLSRPRPDFDYRYEGPYDHLARVKEWQIADRGDDA